MLRFYDSKDVSPDPEIVEKFNSLKLIWVYMGDGGIQSMGLETALNHFSHFAWSYLEEAEVKMLSQLDLNPPVREEDTNG